MNFLASRSECFFRVTSYRVTSSSRLTIKFYEGASFLDQAKARESYVSTKKETECVQFHVHVARASNVRKCFFVDFPISLVDMIGVRHRLRNMKIFVLNRKLLPSIFKFRSCTCYIEKFFFTFWIWETFFVDLQLSRISFVNSYYQINAISAVEKSFPLIFVNDELVKFRRFVEN